jgi:hypothetical protein
MANFPAGADRRGDPTRTGWGRGLNPPHGGSGAGCRNVNGVGVGAEAISYPQGTTGTRYD